MIEFEGEVFVNSQACGWMGLMPDRRCFRVPRQPVRL